MFGLFSVGYLLGVWGACIVFRKGQSEHEEGAARPQKVAVVVDQRIPRSQDEPADR